MSEVNKNIIDGLQTVINGCSTLIKALNDTTATEATEPATKAEVKQEPKKTDITKVMVRSMLADKARNGFREQVKEILKKHNSPDITHLNPDEYEAVYKEAEALKKPEGTANAG